MTQKDNVRRMLKAFEAQFPIYGRAMKLKRPKAYITDARSIVSNPTLAKHKRHPKIDALEEHLQRNEPFFKNLSKIIIELDANPHNQQIKDAVKQITDISVYIDDYEESYDDLHPKPDKDGNPMLKSIEWKDKRIEEKHKEIPSGYTHQTVEMEPEKTLKRMYKKYEKEWKKHND